MTDSTEPTAGDRHEEGVAQPAPAPQSAAPSQAAGGSTLPPPPPPTGAPVPPAAQPGAAAAPQVPQPAATQPKPVYAKGCVTAAWEDIKATPSWLKKMLFLGLLCCVPILNFVVYGYALNWSREVPFGGRTAMPRQVVTGRNFEVGFYYFVISLAFSIPVVIVSLPISFVPVLGSIVTVALSFGVELIVVLCAVRMALSNQLVEGFKLPAVWEALKANWAGLLFIAIVPSLAAGAVMLALMAIWVGLCAALIIPVVAVGAAGSAATVAALGAAAPLIAFLGALFLAALYACMVVSAFVLVLTFRAVAHYVGRYAPEWADQAKVAMGYPV